MAASHTKGTYLAARFRRIASRRGKKRAMVAVGHSILIAAWQMITSDTEYRDQGGDYFIERTGKTRVTQRLVAQLSQLGWRVNLTPAVG